MHTNKRKCEYCIGFHIIKGYLPLQNAQLELNIVVILLDYNW